MSTLRTILIGRVLFALSACATPQMQPVGLTLEEPFFNGNAAVMADSVRLPMNVWQAEKPKAVIIGVHGMNDYAKDLASLAHGSPPKASALCLRPTLVRTHG